MICSKVLPLEVLHASHTKIGLFLGSNTLFAWPSHHNIPFSFPITQSGDVIPALRRYAELRPLAHLLRLTKFSLNLKGGQMTTGENVTDGRLGLRSYWGESSLSNNPSVTYPA
jgi:hypothetical protein